jgi:hypothetical protein
MRRPTVSIRAMLVIVAFIALACVALARANHIWASLMFTASLAVISFAVLAATFRRGAKQAFWIGFALFGWGYLWMAHWPDDPSSGLNGAPRWQLQQDSNGTLATTQLLNYLYNEWLPTIREPPPPAPRGGYGGFGGGGFGGGGLGSVPAGFAFGGAGGVAPPPLVVIDYPAPHEFMHVGHSLFVIVLALVGGLIAVQLYRSRESELPTKREPLTSV